jgi:hypothetical protein
LASDQSIHALILQLAHPWCLCQAFFFAFARSVHDIPGTHDPNCPYSKISMFTIQPNKIVVPFLITYDTFASFPASIARHEGGLIPPAGQRTSSVRIERFCFFNSIHNPSLLVQPGQL